MRGPKGGPPAIDNPRPDAIFALHTFPLPVGNIAHGAAFAGLDQATIELLLTPEKARELETVLQRLGNVATPASLEDFDRLLADLQRASGPLDDAVFVTTSSTVNGERATVQVTLKASRDERYAPLRERIRAIADDIAGAGNYELRFRDAWFPAMLSDPAEGRAAAVTLARVIGAEHVQEMKAVVPIAGEDFALFLRQVPGAMFFLGVANRERGIVGIPHLPNFDADEDALIVGTKAMSAVILERMRATPPR